MLDEPSMGLSPLLVDQVFDIIKDIHKDGKQTVLLVEQNAKKLCPLRTEHMFSKTGSIALSGDAKELMNDDSVKKRTLANTENPRKTGDFLLLNIISVNGADQKNYRQRITHA